ncbi:transcription factor Adf-1-like [Haematobia irritans]|uniref:transcription factor Adf-1-like n=1 Tax=Haematobia irritans TaxID=7368 RepID=UPI003F4FB4C1
MEIDMEAFITEVFTRPVIWDKCNKSYPNRVGVENNWKNIQGVMKKPRDQLKKKWKGLRDQFRNEFKKNPAARSGDLGISEKEYNNYVVWPHYKSLLFLKDQIKPRKSTGNLVPSTESEQILMEEIFAEDIETENSFMDESQSSNEFTKVKKK